MRRIVLLLLLSGLLLVAPGALIAADKITFKPLQDGILQVDSHAPKIWNLYQPGKKTDPLLVQIGSRYLVIYIRNHQVYELKPEQLEHKGTNLLWRDADKPEKALRTTDWSTKDVGSASRVRLTLVDDNHVIDIQIPQTPDLRRGIY